MVDISKQSFVSMVIFTALFFIFGNRVSGSINPLVFFETNDLLIKIGLGILAALGVINFLNYVHTRRIPEDATCPICSSVRTCEGKNIRKFYLSLGGAAKCRHGVWHHGSCLKTLRLEGKECACVCIEKEPTVDSFADLDLFKQGW